MKQLLFSFSGALLICSSGFFVPKKSVVQSKPKEESSIAVLEPDSHYVTLLFAGDIMGHEPQIKAALQPDGSYSYFDNYKFVKEYISQADLAIANLEVTLAGPPYSGYPMFSSPDAIAAAAKEAGFDILQTANNHTCDKGIKGVTRTLDVLDSLGIKHFGSYRSTDEHKQNHPLVVSSGEFQIALLNYTYGTNGMPIPAGTVVNMIDTAQIKTDLKKAKSLGSDFIIATFHWGLEYQRNESAEQTRIAKFSVLHGADLVVGGHPHVVQPIKKLEAPGRDSVWVIYSLGNFISNQRAQFKNGGIAVEIKLLKTKGKTMLRDIRYLPVYVHKPSLPKVSYTLIPGFMEKSADTLLSMNATDKALMNQFFKDTRLHLKNIQEITVNQ